MERVETGDNVLYKGVLVYIGTYRDIWVIWGILRCLIEDVSEREDVYIEVFEIDERRRSGK